jgi:hypothetical protein
MKLRLPVLPCLISIIAIPSITLSPGHRPPLRVRRDLFGRDDDKPWDRPHSSLTLSLSQLLLLSDFLLGPVLIASIRVD